MAIDTDTTGPIFCEYYKQGDYVISAEYSTTDAYEVYYTGSNDAPVHVVGDLSLRLAQLFVDQLY